jgi:dephospho-CoA kinase
LILGLTGGLGSGKTLVTDVFVALGARLVDADMIAREVLSPKSETLTEIIAEFGEDLLRPGGVLNRKRLAGIVFNDAEKLMRINAITHPPIIRIMRERIKELQEGDPDALILVDAPLLIEVGMDKEVDAIVVVYATEADRIKRIIRRDALSEAEIRQRFAAQIPLEDKIKYAKYVIDNSGTIEECRETAEELFNELQKG